jgi:RNA 3'-terminal phosphate cyclase (ATP)
MTIQIDGSFGEGGGQIIRTALALSAITKKSLLIYNIRAKREKPGLQPQHLTACMAVRSVCRGILEGATLHSNEIKFIPGEIIGGEYEFDIGTAGAITMVAQTLIPILLHAKKTSLIRIIGGTHVRKSPSYDYFANVFLPAIQQLGARVSAKLIRPGFFPQGGGVVEIDIKPTELHGCQNWDVKALPQAIIRLANLPRDIANREKQILLENNITNISVSEDEAFSPGNAITIWQGFKGAYIPGERGKRAETVATEVVTAFKSETKQVDTFLADQLLIYAALAKGKTSYTISHISEHARTNAYVIRKFIPREIQLDEQIVIN